MIHLRVPGALRYRDLAVRAVGAACKLVGAGDESPRARGDRTFDHHVISAFSEAFNNAAEHAYHDRPVGEVDIEMHIGNDEITIRVADRGATFNPDAVPAPDLDALPESGLGLFIMRSFMDEVNYSPGQNGDPNVLTMRKRLKDDEP